MTENPSPVNDRNLRKIEIMPSRSEETNDGKSEQVEHAEGCTSNEISFGHSAMTEVQMFVLSQIRVSNLFFVFICILDQFQKTTTLGKLSTIGPLCIVIVTQAVIAMKAFCKDKKRVKEVNERADFKLATKGKNGPPQFRKRSLEDVKPGDLLSFEPKPGEKVNLLLSHDYISQVYVPADVVLVAVACTCHRHLRCFQLLVTTPPHFQYQNEKIVLSRPEAYLHF